MAGLEEMENYQRRESNLEKFERIVALVPEDHAVRESEDYRELRLTLWLHSVQGSIGCTF